MTRPWSLLVVAATLAATPSVDAQTLDARTLPPEVVTEVMAHHEAGTTTRAEGTFVVEAGRSVGDLIVLRGPLIVEGRLTGKTIVVNGDIEVRSGARITGDVLIVGGRLLNTGGGTVEGSVRTYSSRLSWTRRGDRVEFSIPDDDPWWRRRDRWRDRGWGELRLVSARTYNRVEGLPIQVGPAFGREFSWGRLSVDGLGIVRSVNSFEWTPENIGHTAKVEVRLGRERGLKLSARHFDVVESVEPWQLSDTETGLAAFFLHRDFRDYYNRHGGTLGGSLYARRNLEVGGSWSDVRWAARATNDPWTLFRDKDSWRANPAMDDASFRLWQGFFSFDTRSDGRHPTTGWYVSGEYEYGDGVIRAYAPTTSGVRLPSPGGATTYDRAFVDIRRYNRVAPGAQLNLRIAAGGWLSGDELPLQRRFSLGGPGTLPGYDFRAVVPVKGVDRLQCSDYASVAGMAPMGYPGECERMVLAQVEFRGDLSLDPFGILDEDREWRRRGWGRGAQWVVFADAGRGWLVGEPDGGRTFSKSALPPLSTFQTDVGLGIVLDDLGLYLAKPLRQPGAPVNFFVRLRPRF